MSGCVGQNFQGVVSLTSALKTILSGRTFSGYTFERVKMVDRLFDQLNRLFIL